MPSLSGTKLGQYEIIELLGEGGMATVYRARQASINRDVAIKIIKMGLGKTLNFALRFEREAQTVAKLTHPHILKIFDYGQQDEIVYLVMELQTGGNLADLIRKEPLSFTTISRLLGQLASALDYAHRRGIVHRDLKPQNVLIDAEGNAILTDFGIAKLLTENTSFTMTGIVMGTPMYMSPEQWQGIALDGRADIYSLGIILYELLTQKQPFEGETAFTLMHKHVNEPPPSLHLHRPDLPLSYDAVIQKALAKRPDARFATAGELSEAFNSVVAGQDLLAQKDPIGHGKTDIEIQAPHVKEEENTTVLPVVSKDTGGVDNIQNRSPAAAPQRRILPILIVALLVLVLVVVAGVIITRSPSIAVVTAPTIDLTSASVQLNNFASQTALAVVLLQTTTATSSPTFELLFVVPTTSPTLLPATNTAVPVVIPPTFTPSPVTSPTETNTSLPATSVPSSVTPQPTLAPTAVALLPTQTAPIPLSATQLPTTIVPSSTQTELPSPTVRPSLTAVPASPTPTLPPTRLPTTRPSLTAVPSSPTPTLPPVTLPLVATPTTVVLSPTSLPTVRPVATLVPTNTALPPSSTVLPTLAKTNTVVPPTNTPITLPSATPTPLPATNTPTVTPLPPTLTSIPTLLPTATLTPLPPTATVTPTPSQIPFVTGMITYHRYSSSGNSEIYIMNFDGTGEVQLTKTRVDNFRSYPSPDGKSVAFTSGRDGNPEIYVMNVDGSNQRRLTNNPADDGPTGLSWSPDSKRIIFSTNRDKLYQLYIVNVDGSGLRRFITTTTNEYDPAWSPDGQFIAFTSNRSNNNDVYIMNADGTNQRRITRNPTYEGVPSWSPDGKQLLFATNRDGRFEFYVMNADGSNQKRVTQTGTYGSASWSLDGQRIIYTSGTETKRDVFTSRLDGSDVKQLTNYGVSGDYHPNYLP